MTLRLPAPPTVYDRRDQSETRRLVELEFNRFKFDDNGVVPGLIVFDVTAAPYSAAGDGAAVDRAAIVHAITDANAAGGGIVWFPDTPDAYVLDVAITVLENVRLLGAAGAPLIVAKAGFTDDFMFELQSRATVESLTIDGSNLPVPTAAWLGVGAPTGSVFHADGTSVPVDRPTLRNVQVKNVPNGMLFFRSVTNPQFYNVEVTNAQTATAVVRSTVFELYQCTDARAVDCTVNGYTMKAFNLGASTRCKVTRGHAFGPGQDPGHAAFYEDGSTDCSYVDCNHEGVGFSYKAHQATRPVLRGFTAIGSASGPYFQACTDFQWLGGVIQPSTAYGGLIEGIAASGGPVIGGLVEGVTIRRLTPGSSTNHTGIYIAAQSGYPVKDVTIRDVLVENMLFGVRLVNAAGAVYENITIEHLRTLSTVQYSILGYLTSGRISHCELNGGGATPAISIATPTSGVGTRLTINDTTITGCTSTAIQIGAAQHVSFDYVALHDNVVDGAAKIWDITFNAASTDRVGYLSLVNNTLINAAGGTAASVTFNATTNTKMRLVGNSLRNSAGSLANITFLNSGTCNGGVYFGNDVNALVGLPTSLRGADAAFPNITAIAAYAAGSIAIDAEVYQNVFCSGAVVGDLSLAVLRTPPGQALQVTSQVTGPNTVQVTFRNNGVNPVTPTGDVGVRVFPQA